MSRLVASLLGAALLGAVSAAPAAAAGFTPAPGSPVALAGEAVTYFADEGLLEANRGSFNPFEIDGEMLLQHVRLFFVVVDFDGESVHEGEMAIYPQFRTPLDSTEPSPATPAAIYFAFKQNGTCYGGYVAGHPIPDRTLEVDMGGEICHAATVENMLLADYRTLERGQREAEAAIAAAGGGAVSAAPEEDVPLTATAVQNFDPAFPTDLDLEVIVWAAYNAAYARAAANDSVFARTPEDAAALREEMRREILAEGFRGVTITDDPGQGGGGSCSPAGTTVLRFAFTPSGEGIALAAVSDRRVAGKKYDPSVSADIDDLAPRDCAESGLARAGIGRY